MVTHSIRRSDGQDAGARPALRLPALLAGLSLLLGACGGSEERVRIVLITVDTLRYDSLGGGGAEEAMPFTRRFAERGQVFDQFYAATSTTQPTHASLLTGLHPWQHGVTRNGQVLGERFETVSETLSRAGFFTSAVVASFPLEARFGYDQGFDEFHDDFEYAYVMVWEGEALETSGFYSHAEKITDKAIERIDAATSDRQFFWIHYFDPHDPYGDTPTPEGSAMSLPIATLQLAARRGDPEARAKVEAARALYDRDVRMLDSSLARLYDRLDQDDDAYETHVLFTSDHGESFGEQGCIGHGKRLTPEQVHVPFFLVSPRAEPGTRADPAGSVDVAGTILALAGLDATAVQGRDLTRVDDAGSGAFGMRRTFATPKSEGLLDGRVVPVEGERFFTVVDGVLYTGDGTRVFEGDDPRAEVDGAAAAPLRSLFETFEQLLGGVDTEEILDPEVQEALRKLGYTR